MTEHIIPRKKKSFLYKTHFGRYWYRTDNDSDRKGGSESGEEMQERASGWNQTQAAAGDHGHMRCMVHQVTY